MNGILDAAAAVLMLLGAGFVLVAAIGVARLPDIFIRMHAATKAGVVGVGLLLLGVALSFDEAGAWVRVLPAIVFLIVTTPIAAHALARAAYCAGAQLWPGTFADELSEVIPRRVQRLDAGRPQADEREPASADPARQKTASEVDPMTILPFDGRSTAERHMPATMRTRPDTGLRRLLVGLVPGDAGRIAIDQAVRLARETGAELVGLSMVDVPAARRVGAVPLGAMHYARRLSEHRLHEARDKAADVVSAFEVAAAAAGVRYEVRHEEGDPRTLLADASGSFDLVAMPAYGWESDGAEPNGPGLDPLLAAGVRPLLTGTPARREVRHVLLVHDLSQRAGQTVRWFGQTRLWPNATIHVAGIGEAKPTMDATLEEAAAYLGAHGYAAEAIGPMPQSSVAADPLADLPFRCDVAIIANAGSGGRLQRLQADPGRRLRDARCTLVLG